jgi:hypothetical protein
MQAQFSSFAGAGRQIPKQQLISYLMGNAEETSSRLPFKWLAVVTLGLNTGYLLISN